MRIVLGVLVLVLMSSAAASAQIPRVGAEAEAIRRRNKIKYKNPRPAEIQVISDPRGQKKPEGTLLQPVKKKPPKQEKGPGDSL